MKILLTGGSGQLGKEILKNKPKQFEILIKNRNELNLLSKSSCIENIKRYNPDWIINCAAYTNVDKAEEEKEFAYSINSLAPKYLSEAIKEYGGDLLHISTDYVFNGMKGTPYLPNDDKSPLNNYGYTKAKGEDYVIETLSDLNRGNILRTSWLISNHGNNFALKILKKISDKEELNVVSDQVGAPTTAYTLSKACWKAIIQKSNGIKIPRIMHYSDSGIASWYDIAESLLEVGKELNLFKEEIKISPILSKSFPSKVKRPHYSVLDTIDTLNKLSLDYIHWRKSIKYLLNQFKNSNTFNKL